MSTVIGAQTFLRGRVHGAGDLEIAGHVEGDVSVTGDVVVEAGHELLARKPVVARQRRVPDEVAGLAAFGRRQFMGG